MSTTSPTLERSAVRQRRGVSPPAVDASDDVLPDELQAAPPPPSIARKTDAQPQGFFWDLATFEWMTNSLSSLKLSGLIVSLYLVFSLVGSTNPFRSFILLSHQVPASQVLLAEPSAATNGLPPLRYQKGYLDLAFVFFYVIVFSFVRQISTLYLFKPLAQRLGITDEVKQTRFMEQGYGFLYWATASVFGLYVMSFQDSWWFQMEHLWIKYPHWIMRPELKAYYLLQSSYWAQQALVVLLRLEKPRKDYNEMVAHHLVTLWLIFWSYLINLTQIGTLVFVSMDIPDTFLTLAKLSNYVDGVAGEIGTTTFFSIFMIAWTYFRIYLSACTLWSVWFQFELIPAHTKEWNPPQGWWLVWWMQYQVLAPLILLFGLNCFWYSLMWKILIGKIRGKEIVDEREEGEYVQRGEKAKGE